MKNTIMPTLALVTLTTFCSCNENASHSGVESAKPDLNKAEIPSSEMILGEWKYSDEKKTLVITFSDENKVVMQVNEASAKGVYKLNAATDPWQLDITWNEEVEFKTIISFPDKNKLQMEENNPGEERPMAFTAKAYTLELTR